MMVKNVIDFLYYLVGEWVYECLMLCLVGGIIVMIIGVSMMLLDMILLGVGLIWFCLVVVFLLVCVFCGLYGNVLYCKVWLIGGWWFFVVGVLVMLVVVMNIDSLILLLFGVMVMWFVVIVGFLLVIEMVYEVENNLV